MSSEIEPMEVSYAIARKDVKSYYDDYIAYAESSRLPHLHYTEAARTLYNFINYGIPSLVLLALMPSYPLGVVLILSPIGFYLWIGLVYGVWYRYGLRRLYRKPGFIGEHRVRVDSDGFSGRITGISWTVHWPHIADIAVTRNHILFIGSPTTDGMVHTVPLHAFSSRQEAERFVEHTIRLWKHTDELTPKPSE
jgi:hypothetical protein